MTDTIDRPTITEPEPEPPVQAPLDNPLRLVALVGGLAALGLVVNPWVLAIILALLVSVFLHELGHFWVARRSGMKVTEFFIGIGPRLWSFRRGEVEYGVKAVPIAAYVRIIGMHNLEPVDPVDEPRTYRQQSYPKRLATVLAGPAANIAIGVVLFFGLYVAHGIPQDPDQLDTTWTVAQVVPGTAAAAAGIEAGDRVVAIDGLPAEQWSQLTTLLDERAGQEVTLTLERDGEPLEAQAELGWGLSDVGAEAIPSRPALTGGTRVLAIEGEALEGFPELQQVLAAPGDPVTLTVETAAGRFLLDVDRPLALPDEGVRAFLGVSREPDPVDGGPADAAVAAVRTVPETASAMGQVLGNLFSPSGLSRYAELVVTSGESARQAEAGVPALRPADAGTSGAGPAASPPPEERIVSIVGIVNVGGQIGDSLGWSGLLGLLALVNIFLALINLVPLLPFDGGHALVATYEAIRGKLTGRIHRVDIAKLMPLTYAVVFVLLGLGLSAIWLDVTDPLSLP
ncbi:MAG: site-2 protease family protein [Acidimicrobiia bacterium]|nr:site-2 protease family protein [Acidimicrobiia bacterium]